MVNNRKNDILFHEKAKQAAIYSYGNKTLPETYRKLDSIDNSKSGFHAEILTNGKDIIIAYRGTNNILGIDGRNDLAMYRGNIPAQATEALWVYDEIKEKYPNTDITVVGHSLGGSLAQIVSAMRGPLAITFNAYGTKDLFKKGSKLITDNAVNYVNEYDSIAMSNGENHIGETYAVPSSLEGAHYIESFGSLSKRTFRTPEELKKNWYRLHPNAAAKQDILDNHNHRRLEQRQNMKDWMREQARRLDGQTGNIHNTKECSGSYYVKGYIRKDGSKVDGYTRDCWLHGN